jgi:hypothetical protein
MNLSGILLAVFLLQPNTVDTSAEGFVRDLYHREAHETKADEEAFAGHRGADSIYSPSLLALIRRDVRTTPSGYVGKLDYDPICGCQDADGISVRSLRVVVSDKSNAKAIVNLSFPGEAQLSNTLKLVRTATGWRVDDVEGPDGAHSLRSRLISKRRMGH